MANDLGSDEPGFLGLALAKISQGVDPVHNEISRIPHTTTSEIFRLHQSFPVGPTSIGRTLFVAADSTRETLDQVAWIIRQGAPTSMIALLSLLRVALVGAARIVYVTLPADPDVRLRNAEMIMTQEARGYKQALDRFAQFNGLDFMKPEPDEIDAATRQWDAIHDGHRPPGDGAVLGAAAAELTRALERFADDPTQHTNQMRDHVALIWNAYSGIAHTHAWPRLLPSTDPNREYPGDFVGDLLVVANAGQMAMESLRARLQPDTAGTDNIMTFE